MRRQAADGSWPDLLVPSDSSAADRKKVMDPDVFVLPDGEWVMFAGCVRYFKAEGSSEWKNYQGNPLGRYAGDPADLSWSWSNAFQP